MIRSRWGLASAASMASSWSPPTAWLSLSFICQQYLTHERESSRTSCDPVGRQGRVGWLARQRPGGQVAPVAPFPAELRVGAGDAAVHLDDRLPRLAAAAAAGQEGGVAAEALEARHASRRPLVGGVGLGGAAERVIGSAEGQGGLGRAALIAVLAELFQQGQALGGAA